MKFVFLSGGVLGFVTGLVTSWQLDHAADRVFLDAAIGCLVGGVLFRWFWTIVLSGLRETVLARQRASLATPPVAAQAAKAK